MIKSKKQMYLVIGAFALVLMLGTVTYAFFNYTRTGSANNFNVGRIAFNSEQTGNAINLTNVFPIDVSNGIPNDATKVGTVTINITGDTEYSEGIEYLVTATNVTNTVGNKPLPISIDVSVASNTGNDPVTTLGTEDNDYFTNKGPSASTSIYKVLAGETISNNDQLLVGYIKSGATGVDGNIIIRAYIDASKVVISDTYPEATIRTVKTENYSSSDCETALTGVTNASTYCATASSLQDAIDNEDLTSAQITLLVNAGIVEEYTNGTPASFGEGKTVFTTSEWNSLQANGVSFQIKVEAQEGTWVEEPVVPGTIPSCPGCKFMYTTNTYYYEGATNVSDITETVSTNYNDVITNDRKYFLGFTEVDDGNGNMVIDRAFACGIKGTDNNGNVNQGTPFCIEGTTDYGGKYNDSVALITGPTLWNDSDFTAGRCTDEEHYVRCAGSTSWNDPTFAAGSFESISALTYSDGFVDVGYAYNSLCGVYYEGDMSCLEPSP